MRGTEVCILTYGQGTRFCASIDNRLKSLFMRTGFCVDKATLALSSKGFVGELRVSEQQSIANNALSLFLPTKPL